MNPLDIHKAILEILRWDIEKTASLLTGLVFGVLLGWNARRWFGPHRPGTEGEDLARLEERFKRLSEEREVLIQEVKTLKGENSRLRGTSVDTLAEDARWGEMTDRLVAQGLNPAEVSQLRECFKKREITLLNSDGRQRIRIWTHGTKRTPVAIIWRGGRNYRVLFPDDTENLVPIAELGEVEGADNG